MIPSAVSIIPDRRRLETTKNAVLVISRGSQRKNREIIINIRRSVATMDTKVPKYAISRSGNIEKVTILSIASFRSFVKPQAVSPWSLRGS